jgi:hypothetical protein
MTYAMSIRFECFGMTILEASAIDLEDKREGLEWTAGGVLRLSLPNDASISLYMPYEAALAYASAINTCNDREAIERVKEPNAFQKLFNEKGTPFNP